MKHTRLDLVGTSLVLTGADIQPGLLCAVLIQRDCLRCQLSTSDLSDGGSCLVSHRAIMNQESGTG